MAGKIVCFGEIMLRLSAPGHERFLQSAGFEVNYAGAEANVAVSLAGFGHDVRMASVLSDNALGEAAVAALRGQGLDVDGIARAPGRMGLYFLETGAVTRPSRIVYDRQNSAFALADTAGLDWAALLDGAGWLHVSGVTPAIGPSGCAGALAAVEAAVAAGVKVSFDGNYRGQMWALWDGDPPGVLRRMLAAASFAFINERDIGLILGETFEGPDPRATAYERAFATFPRLEAVAATTRNQSSVTNQILQAELVTRDGARVVSQPHNLAGVVDRIGGGDAFAAGVLHGWISGRDAQYCIEFGVAAGALKHSIPGDFNRVSVEEVEAAMEGGSMDVKR